MESVFFAFQPTELMVLSGKMLQLFRNTRQVPATGAMILDASNRQMSDWHTHLMGDDPPLAVEFACCRHEVAGHDLYLRRLCP